MAETVCKRKCSAVYFQKDTFDFVAVVVSHDAVVVAAGIEDWTEEISAVDEKHDIVELVATV